MVQQHLPHDFNSIHHDTNCCGGTKYLVRTLARWQLAHLNHRTGEVYEMPAYEKAGQAHCKGRAQAGNNQDDILCLLEHGGGPTPLLGAVDRLSDKI